MHHRYSTAVQANDAGRNTRAENFEVIARAAVTPTSNPRRMFGFSSHNRKANRADTNIAATGMSVVARPACASSGGVVARIAAVATAATAPKSR